jgi:hypothetical protein
MKSSGFFVNCIATPLMFWSGTVLGQTVINVPPQAAPAGVGSDMTVNLLDGGTITPSDTFNVSAPDGSGQNAVLNIQGGKLSAPSALARVSVNQGGQLNVSGGDVVGDLFIRSGGQATIDSGQFWRSETDDTFSIIVDAGGILAVHDGNIDSGVTVRGVASASGGAVQGYGVQNGGVLDLTGGTFGYLQGSTGASIRLKGAQFRVDGALIPGTSNVGDVVPFNPSENLTLSGLLSDGMPFCILLAPYTFQSGVLTLETVDTQPSAAEVFRASAGSLPHGIGAGQTLIADNGGIVPRYFMAGPGSAVSIEPGASFGLGFKAHQATVDILGGEVGQGYGVGLTAVESRVTLKDGFINSPRMTHRSEFDMAGGRLGSELQLTFGSKATISGGIAPYVSLFGESELKVTGGTIENQIEVWSGSKITFSGGTFAGLRVHASGILELRGQDFKLDQQGIVGLEPGKPFTITDRNRILSGILADGSPFSLNLAWPSDFFGDGVSPQATLRVVAVPEPTAVPLVVIAGVVAGAIGHRRQRSPIA